jgi:alpha-beta hydrolase superfamily lysophospholipase/DNA-binding CsgD family transcriptional regulator
MIASADGTALLLRQLSGARAGGPVVLLGHGPSVHSGLLDGAMAAFAQGGAAVWAGDLRGHGGSISARAAAVHLDPSGGWERLVDDMAAFAATAFRGVPRADRVLVGGGVSGHLMLDLLRRDPGVAQHLVMAGPTPDQPALARLIAAFLGVRRIARPLDRPDPQMLHHLYGFLRAQLPPGSGNADTISADPAIVQRVLDDPRGFPTPTLGYWLTVLPGIQASWGADRGALPADLRVLILTGPEDPQTRGGRLVPRMLDWFAARGVPDARAVLLDGVRANILIDAGAVPVAPAVLDWVAGRTPPPPAAAPSPVAPDVTEAYLPALQALGLAPQGGLPPLPMLIDLCYAALDDDSRWIELLYRLCLVGDGDAQQVEQVLEALHPHWQRAFELREELRQAATMGRLYHDLIDRLDLGVAVLDAEGRMRHLNPAFGRALARLTGAEPPATLDAAERALRALEVGSAVAGGGLADRPVLFQGQVVGVSFVPASLRGARQTVEPLGRLIVLRAPGGHPGGAVGDRSHRAGLLALAYGLTGQEGAVALHLAEGLGTDATARALGISEHTVRSHLKQVFDKMDLSSRTELAHRVLAGPLGWLARPDADPGADPDANLVANPVGGAALPTPPRRPGLPG